MKQLHGIDGAIPRKSKKAENVGVCEEMTYGSKI